MAAETAFLQLGDYEDSADMVLRCRYGQGLRLLDEKAYPEAEEIFTALGQWEDSADLVLRCRYEQGKEFLAAEDYAGAMELFSGLAEYQDAPALLEQARWKQLHSFLIRQPFADVDGGCLVGITAFDPDQLTLWVEKTMDLGFYVVTDRCEISFTLGQAQGQYLLQTQTQTKADGLTGRSSTTASGAVELASLTADTLLPLTNVSFYGEDVYGNIYHDSLTWGAVLTNPQGLLKTLLEHIPAILEQSGAGYTLQELGLGEF